MDHEGPPRDMGRASEDEGGEEQLDPVEEEEQAMLEGLSPESQDSSPDAALDVVGTSASFSSSVFFSRTGLGGGLGFLSRVTSSPVVPPGYGRW